MNGPHALVAKAYDLAGNEGVSPAVTVLVQNVSPDTVPPTVTLALAIRGKNLKATVRATDPGGVARLDLFIDGRFHSSSTVNPVVFSVNLKTLASGQHTAQAQAADRAGNVGQSAALSFRR